jgi:prepilin-type N-terminal cleavage/methylation domain-containing protein/prepilin-type processing-associated H-X9-DG protein
MSAPPRQLDRFGFSLIEILVVIAIIAILAAIGMPAYRAFITKSQAAQCVSNLRQLAVVVQDYTHDYGHYPSIATQNADGKHIDPPMFYAYVARRKEAKCVICPAAEYHGINAGQPPLSAHRMQGAYGANPYVMPHLVKPDADGNMQPQRVRPLSITRPSEVVLLADSGQQGNPPTFVRAVELAFNWGNYRPGDPAKAEEPIFANTSFPGSSLTSHGFPGPLLPLRHGGRGHVLFCDGHVISITNVTQLKQKNLYWNY